MNTFPSDMVRVLVPEIGLLLLSAVLLIITLIKNKKMNSHLGWITALGLGMAMLATVVFSRPGDVPLILWGDMLRYDHASFLFRVFILLGGALTALFASADEKIHIRPEFYLLLVFSNIGLSLMTVSGNLILLFLAVETASLSLYVMVGMKYRDERSVESGLKYFLFGALSSALMLYGFSLLYGFGGTTNIYALAGGITAKQVPLAGLILAAMLVLAGFAFKISAVPFHFWAPDVYEGAPTPVAGYLSTVSKAAGFAALLRLLIHVFDINPSNVWMILIAVMAIASMLVGNLMAIPQKNIKRMLAFSSIAQAGYILIGVSTGSPLGVTGVAYYLVAYIVTNLAAFATIAWLERTTGSSELTAFSGLNRRSSALALIMMSALLSLGGVPPFPGFFAKLLVFGAAVQSGMVWLAIVGILNSVIGLYYYLRVMKLMYAGTPLSTESKSKPPILWRVALGICLLVILLMGVFYTPWYALSNLAAAGF